MKKFKYTVLAEQLKAEIDAHKWQVHEKLPSIRRIATQYQLAKISVQKALHTLEARGLVYVKAKSGYYVAPVRKVEKIAQHLTSLAKPKLVDVPDVFYQIMERSAAFDIAPRNLDNAKTPNYLLMLNRHLSRAIRQTPQNNALYYSEPLGELALREQISIHYRKRSLDISAQEICITSGCQNSLFFALMATCQPGDIVAIESPAFYGVLQLLQQLKLKVLEIPSSSTNGITAESLRLATNKWQIKACILTANFATPTGALIPSNEKRSLVTLAKEKGITLIEDDIYGDLGFHDKVEPLKSYDQQNTVILCSSFSKSLSRDLRIGWIVTKDLKPIQHLKLIHQLSTSQALQAGLSSFLAEGHFERHVYQYRKTLLNQREQLLSAIKAHWQFSTKFTVPAGGLAIWVELPNAIDSFSLYHQAIAENIVLTPGRLFSAVDQFSNFLRLSFAHPMTGHRLAALKRLGVLCQQALAK